MFRKKNKPEEEPKPDISKDSYEDFAADEHLTPEEAQAKIALIMTETKKPEILSELTNEEIGVLASMQTLAKDYKLGMTEKFIKNFLLFRVSNKRQGRKEVIEIAKGGERQEDKMKRTLKSMVLGLR